MYGLNKDRMAILNRIAVMKILYKEGKSSKRELAKKLNLSIPAISNILRGLENDSYLISTGKLEKSYGRHQGFWSIFPQKDVYLCVNILPTLLQFLVVDACLEPISNLEKYIVDLSSFPQMVECITQKIHIYLKKYPSISKISLACHGIIEYETGNSTFMPRLSHKEYYPLREKLQENLSVPIKIDNSCNIYALSEKWLGAGGQFDNFIWINLDRGVGGAVVFNNELFRGKNYTAGELGHLEIIENGIPCPCGGKGCLEAYVNSSKILAEWQKHFPSANSLTPFFKAVHTNNPQALEILNNITGYLKKGISPIISLLNPQHIFLGGSLTQIGSALLLSLQNNLYTSPIYKLHLKNDISFSTLSENNLLAGSAFLWIEDELNYTKSDIQKNIHSF